ncbi:MAG: hypothetical protein KME28_24745 [Pelatocladus maniniholoensis HA4357-MV3]|uniref:Uncharacterized protein n=1 Tax=Pelatocladus maniniholoensis HA4357-MV3 TaxID=1117104 RepID=A0A9E3LVN4_9NOST|nr:hypothetical protein [Pelatocladus maniniholoensis HA4357-MV3]
MEILLKFYYFVDAKTSGELALCNRDFIANHQTIKNYRRVLELIAIATSRIFKNWETLHYKFLLADT